MEPPHPTPPIGFLDSLDGAVLLRDPERRRLLEVLRESPDSASGLAARLGEKRQRLNYHLRVLEEAGVLELDRERPRGNLTERILRPTAEAFVLDPGLAGGVPEVRDPGDRASAGFLLSLVARAVRDVGRLWRKAGEEGKRLATVGIESRVVLARPKDMPAFVDDLVEAVSAVVMRHHDERGSGRPFRIVLGAYPEPGPDSGAARNSRPGPDAATDPQPTSDAFKTDGEEPSHQRNDP